MKQLVFRSYAKLRASNFLRRLVKGLRIVGFDRQSLVLLLVGRMLRDGNFNSAAARLNRMKTKNERAWRTLLYCYFASYHFEDLVSAYETMPEPFRRDSECRYLYLIALANQQRPTEVAETIQAVLEEPPGKSASLFLSRVYPLAVRVNPQVHKPVVERIVSYAPELAMEQFDVILSCAHFLREKEWTSEALPLESALRSAAINSQRQVKLDVLDAQMHFWERRYDGQLEAMNRALQRQGLDPIGLHDNSLPLVCSNLKPGPGSKDAIHGPLVSILMPAFNAAGTIGYALESLKNQTYRDLEVIVVDDASNDETARIVSEFSAADPRFRLIPLDQNSGAFVARNIAKAAATGEFVTNQDADDWAHPQKIALAVAELQRHPSIVATWVEHVRCSSRHGFRALGGYIRKDASSLMFRNKAVTEKIGWYDSVRAAGDGEFHLRLERAFGRRSIRLVNKLLSFVSWSEASLSGGGAFQIEDELGIFSPPRNAYRRSFGLWQESAGNLYMPFPLESRPFPAPPELLPRRGGPLGS